MCYNWSVVAAAFHLLLVVAVHVRMSVTCTKIQINQSINHLFLTEKDQDSHVSVPVPFFSTQGQFIQHRTTPAHVSCRAIKWVVVNRRRHATDCVNISERKQNHRHHDVYEQNTSRRPSSPPSLPSPAAAASAAPSPPAPCIGIEYTASQWERAKCRKL